MTPLLGPPFLAIHFATRRQWSLAGYLPVGGLGRLGLAIGECDILVIVLSRCVCKFGIGLELKLEVQSLEARCAEASREQKISGDSSM